MNSPPLPKYIHPQRLCEEKTVMTGVFPMSRFERLKDMLAGTEGDVVLQLTFDRDEQRLFCITGNLHVTWSLICQRCGGKMPQTLDIPVSLSPIFREEAAKTLPERYDPLLMEEDKILLLTMIEDELLLGMPVVPRHDTENCIMTLQKFNKNRDNGGSS